MSISARILAFGLFLFVASSCNPDSKSTDEKSSTTHTSTPGAALPVLTEVPPSTDFPNAQLAYANVTANKLGADSAKVSFAFNVTNYVLKNQTADSTSKLCNNSEKGQHIHFILDNKPYVALYEPKHEVNLPLNSEHYLLCFLSRSYHESIKSKGAAAILHFKIDAQGAVQLLPEPKTPMVFYSRPKGDYLGKDTANVLLDYYLWNTGTANEYVVKAEVRNETTGADTTFTLTDWKPYFLQRLGTGKIQIMMNLMDKDGNPITGPNTAISRGFRLAAAEPMP